jgi:uncharacterized protein (DUF362 family)
MFVIARYNIYIKISMFGHSMELPILRDSGIIPAKGKCLLMKDISLIKVKQHFPRPFIGEIDTEIIEQLRRLKSSIRPGMSVAVTAGSRGITGIPVILRTVVEALSAMGAKPFIVSAMGSHGGGTIKGQRHVLDHLGITEQSTGADIRITSEAVEIGNTPSGHTLYLDAEAAKADAILPVNRIKPHTAFRDNLASGLFKMLTVGLGKVPGATQVHRLSSAGMYQAIIEMGRQALDKLPVIGGLAIIENGCEETAVIELLLPSEMEDREMELLKYANSLLPGLPLRQLDILIIEEMGKNFSGTGMDTNIIGRWKIADLPEPDSPRIARIIVLRLSKASDGNANGLGLADLTTRKLVEAIDWKATLMNVRTTGFWERAFCPPFPGSDRDAIEWAFRGLEGKPDKDITVARIRNTLQIEELWLNATAFLQTYGCEKIGLPETLQFASDGDLLPSK